MTIYPTHTCFDDAMDFLETTIKEGKHPREYIVNNLVTVHAICIMPDGTKYAHAWIEEGDSCIFKGRGECLIDGKMEHLEGYMWADKKEFYAYYNVQETTHYSLEQVWKENKKHATTGPWIDKYKKLCSTSRKMQIPLDAKDEHSIK
jgi:hypothetical protein